MCGLAGFIGSGNRDILVSMTNALSHRGPDSAGFAVESNASVYLGHRRLSILDAPHGQQPMWDGARNVCVVFNGEIYNHGDLRRELESAGHVFSSDHSDTEVLVEGYKAWGQDLPRKLNGMFAFVIYDARRETLFMARDQFGEKPLYYMHEGNTFVFSSEVPSLLLHPVANTAPDPVAIQKFFAYGFLPAPLSFRQGHKKLPAGCCLTLDLRTNTTQQTRYWAFQIQHDRAFENISLDEAAEELSVLLRRATSRRLIADVPLGVFLSGGIDSSSVLSCMASIDPDAAVKTFTIGFQEPSFDESENARKISDFFNTEHHEKIISVTDMMDILPGLLGRMGEPIADPSLLPTHILSAFANEQVTVALTGDGGDELFAGYDPFRALKASAAYDTFVPKPVHRMIRSLSGLMPPSDKNMSLDFKVRRFLQGQSHPKTYRNAAWLAPLDPGRVPDVFYDPMRPEDLYSEAIDAWQATPQTHSFTDKTLDFFTRFYLTENILSKVDRAAMFTSLETRAVFLDPELVDFATRLPTHLKYDGRTTKRVLKHALRSHLPSDVLKRPKKGFGIPVSAWLKKMPFPETLNDIPGVRQGVMKTLWEEHRRGKQDHRIFLFAAMALAQCLHPSAGAPP